MKLGILISEKITSSLVEAIKAPPGNMAHVCLSWLGQAGFAIRYCDTLIVVDPYLSDYLADKYQNAEFKHLRMMTPPILPQEAAVADWMLATHKHSDHFDPWTVSGMFAFNTINPKEARQAIQRNASIDTGCCAELDVMYTLMEKDQNDDGSF